MGAYDRSVKQERRRSIGYEDIFCYNEAMELLHSYRFATFESKLYAAGPQEATDGADLIVADIHTHKLLQKLTGHSLEKPVVVLSPGEEHKTLEQVEQILRHCCEKKLSRSSTILAFGGGLVCDLAGFAAATYMRGTRLVLVPTTLLAMVDAGLGGKTGCNFQNYKNLVGSFYPASEVRIIPEALATLSAAEFQSGMAEVIKHSLLAESPHLWDKLHSAAAICAPILAREPQPPGISAAAAPEARGAPGGDEVPWPQKAAAELRPLIIEAVQIKGAIVERDLYEQGERAFLNLGHTFAHALETVSAFRLSHGRAVAWGIHQALQLSTAHGFCSLDYAQQVQGLLEKFGFALRLSELLASGAEKMQRGNAQLQQLVDTMALDKKRSQSGIRLVLQTQRGGSLVREIPAEWILASLQEHA